MRGLLKFPHRYRQCLALDKATYKSLSRSFLADATIITSLSWFSNFWYVSTVIWTVSLNSIESLKTLIGKKLCFTYFTLITKKNDLLFENFSFDSHRQIIFVSYDSNCERSASIHGRPNGVDKISYKRCFVLISFFFSVVFKDQIRAQRSSNIWSLGDVYSAIAVVFIEWPEYF